MLLGAFESSTQIQSDFAGRLNSRYQRNRIHRTSVRMLRDIRCQPSCRRCICLPPRGSVQMPAAVGNRHQHNPWTAFPLDCLRRLRSGRWIRGISLRVRVFALKIGFMVGLDVWEGPVMTYSLSGEVPQVQCHATGDRSLWMACSMQRKAQTM